MNARRNGAGHAAWALPGLATALAALTVAAGAPAAAMQAPDSDFVCNGLDSRDVLRSIEHLGPKPWTAREGIFYFHGDEEALPALEAGLRGLGFAVRLTRSAPGRIAAVNTAINEEWLADTMPRLCQLAADLGVQYDGWGISVPEALDRKTSD